MRLRWSRRPGPRPGTRAQHRQEDQPRSRSLRTCGSLAVRTIHAIYENGVFRPTTPVDLPEGSEVRIEPQPVGEPAPPSPHLRRIYELLNQSEDTGDPHLSERHDEHQP